MDIPLNTFLGWELARVILAASPNPRLWVWEQPWAPHSDWHIWDDLWRDSSKENPFWVITRGPMRTDFQEWLSYPREISHKNGTKIQRILFLSWWEPSTAMLGWKPGIGPMKIHLRGIWDLPTNKQCCANPRDPQQEPQDIPASPILWSQPMNGQNPLPHYLLPAQNPKCL